MTPRLLRLSPPKGVMTFILRHAGMLMVALGIVLICSVRI